MKVELETIRFTGFARYFLTVWDYIYYAKHGDPSKNINPQKVGAARGSAAGSLVVYCLGITGIDPIKYGLSMDRFLFAEAEYKVSDSDFFSEVANIG